MQQPFAVGDVADARARCYTAGLWPTKCHGGGLAVSRRPQARGNTIWATPTARWWGKERQATPDQSPELGFVSWRSPLWCQASASQRLQAKSTCFLRPKFRRISGGNSWPYWLSEAVLVCWRQHVGWSQHCCRHAMDTKKPPGAACAATALCCNTHVIAALDLAVMSAGCAVVHHVFSTGMGGGLPAKCDRRVPPRLDAHCAVPWSDGPQMQRETLLCGGGAVTAAPTAACWLGPPQGGL